MTGPPRSFCLAFHFQSQARDGDCHERGRPDCSRPYLLLPMRRSNERFVAPQGSAVAPASSRAFFFWRSPATGLTGAFTMRRESLSSKGSVRVGQPRRFLQRHKVCNGSGSTTLTVSTTSPLSPGGFNRSAQHLHTRETQRARPLVTIERFVGSRSSSCSSASPSSDDSLGCRRAYAGIATSSRTL